MVMPERTFGRTVRYRRSKLGLSQTKLGELVGRSTATIRSWERDRTKPNDPKVIAALAAVLGVNERQLFGKADVDLPTIEETSPTVEEALATLTAEHAAVGASSGGVVEPRPVPEPISQLAQLPAYVSPPDTHVRTPLTPTLGETSYMEDSHQRQVYKIRTLATMVALVALVVAFIWAIGEGLGALGEWWDEFFGNLRL